MISSLSVIIPAFNEAANIGEAVERSIDVLESLKIAYEVVVVNDGSSDNTLDVLQRLSEIFQHLKVINSTDNAGKGNALRKGFRAARYDWVLFTDADLQISMNELPAFLRQSDSHRLIVGVRTGRDDGLVRRLISRSYQVVCKGAFGIAVSDVNCPYKLIKRDFLNSLSLSSDGFTIDAELLFLASRRGCSAKEVPVAAKARTRGQSSVSWRHIPRLMRELIVMRFHCCKNSDG